MQNTEFAPFAAGNVVKAVAVSGCDLTRKQIDKLCADVEVQSGFKPYWFKMDENGELAGGVAKFVNSCKDALGERLGLTPGTLVAVSAGKHDDAVKTAGVMRKMLGNACQIGRASCRERV